MRCSRERNPEWADAGMEECCAECARTDGEMHTGSCDEYQDDATAGAHPMPEELVTYMEEGLEWSENEMQHKSSYTGKAITLLIKSMCGKSLTLRVPIMEEADALTIGHLKVKLEKVEGIGVDEQRLTSGTKILLDESPIHTCGIHNGLWIGHKC